MEGIHTHNMALLKLEFYNRINYNRINMYNEDLYNEYEMYGNY